MILAYGSLAGQPEFAEMIQMIVVKDALLFIVRKLSTRNITEHSNSNRRWNLLPQLILQNAERMRLVTLKRYLYF